MSVFLELWLSMLMSGVPTSSPGVLAVPIVRALVEMDFSTETSFSDMLVSA